MNITKSKDVILTEENSTNLSPAKTIKNDYKIKRKELKVSFKNEKNSAKQMDKFGYRVLKDENFEQRKLLATDEFEDLMDVTRNKTYQIYEGAKLKIILRYMILMNFFTNFFFNRYVSKKKVFTVSMAGEILWKSIAINTVRGLFLAFMGLIIIFPFYWMISIAFRSNDETIKIISGSVNFWPEEWSLDSFKFLFNNPATELSVYRFIWNSVLIGIISTLTQTIASLLAGFGLSHYNSKGKEVLIIVILATMMLPGEALLIGQFIFASKINLQNTIWALFVPFIGNAFTIFMFKNAFDGVNGSIKKAAKIDGVSTFKFFWKVAIPLIKTTIFTSMLISFIASWNAVLWPQMVLKSDNEWATLPMLLWQIVETSTESNGLWSVKDLRDPQNLKMAVSIIAVAPMFIVFVFTKKYLVKGITKDSGAKE